MSTSVEIRQFVVTRICAERPDSSRRRKNTDDVRARSRNFEELKRKGCATYPKVSRNLDKVFQKNSRLSNLYF